MEENKNTSNVNTNNVLDTSNVNTNNVLDTSNVNTNINESRGFVQVNNVTSENGSVLSRPSDSMTNVNTINNDLNTSNVNTDINTSNKINTTNVSTFVDNNLNVNTYTDVPKVQPQYEEVEIKKEIKSVRTDSYFDGKLLDLFGWTFLKNIITIITFGIAYPWGECILLDYELSHTVINGKRLKFNGKGGSLFVEYFKWVFFTIITFGIYSFWIPVKKTKWILSNISFEDEEYVRDESYFDGKVIQLIGINILCNFLNCISLFILYPFTQCIKLRWIAKHSVINRKKIVFDGKALGLFGRYILWLFLTMITFGIYGLWLNIKMIRWKVEKSRLKLVGEEEVKDKSILVMAILFVVFFIIVIIVLINNPFSFDITDFGPQQSQINDSIGTGYYDYYR